MRREIWQDPPGPLHTSACRALARYTQQRDALLNPAVTIEQVLAGIDQKLGA
jgi:hypothetical protein